jgi:hypothetical protein
MIAGEYRGANRRIIAMSISSIGDDGAAESLPLQSTIYPKLNHGEICGSFRWSTGGLIARALIK